MSDPVDNRALSFADSLVRTDLKNEGWYVNHIKEDVNTDNPFPYRVVMSLSGDLDIQTMSQVTGFGVSLELGVANACIAADNWNAAQHS